MHFDTHGRPQRDTPVKVNLRYFGVQFEGKDLQPEGNPHTVPLWFARELISSNRALPAVEPEGEVVNRDPSVQHRDPRPRGQR